MEINRTQTLKQSPCANYRVSDCKNFVTKRGTILCDSCVSLSQEKRQRDDISLSLRFNQAIKELEEKNDEIEKLHLFIKQLSSEHDKEMRNLSYQVDNERKLHDTKTKISQLKMDELTITNTEVEQLQQKIDLYKTQNYDLTEINKKLEKEILQNKELILKLESDIKNLQIKKSRLPITKKNTLPRNFRPITPASSPKGSPTRNSPKRSSPTRNSPKRSSPTRSSPTRSSPKKSIPKKSSPKKSILPSSPDLKSSKIVKKFS